MKLLNNYEGLLSEEAYDYNDMVQLIHNLLMKGE